jgi:hypothetical protein
MADETFDVESFRTGDLILSSGNDVQAGEDWRAIDWSRISIVIQPTDFGSPGQVAESLCFDPISERLESLVNTVDDIPGSENVFVARVDRAQAPQLWNDIAGHLDQATEPISIADFMERLRDALGETDFAGERSETSLQLEAIGNLSYDPPTVISRTCKFDGNSRPCPIHG